MRISVLLALVIRLTGPMVFCCGADALTISWGDLKHTVANRPVIVEVESATILRGSLLEADDGGVLLAVLSSKPRSLYAKYQNARIEREKITAFHVVKDPKRTRWRWMGTVAGYIGGIGLGVLTGGGEQDPRILIGLVGGMTLGYYAGKEFDKATLELQFLDKAARTGTPQARARELPGYLQSPESSGFAVLPAARSGQ